jgi:molybdopterin converting factor small subunit
VLAQISGGKREYVVQGATILEALQNAARLEPILAGHFFDDAGVVRRHIQCVHNENDYYRARDGLDIAVGPGDTIAVMNAVSGGTG